MNPQFPPLNQLRVFECVARHQSFTVAAQELHITQGAVSHQIRALETWLGFRLFERRGGKLKLTNGAVIYAEALKDVFAEIVRATYELASTGAHRILNIRGHTTFFTHWLVPLLPSFQREYPDIKVRLSADVEGVDFRRDQADVGIRYGEGDWPGLRADLLFNDELTPVLSPALAATLDDPADAGELLSLPLLHSNRRPAHWPDWMQGAGVRRGVPAGDMYFEDLSIIYECAIQGMGVALGQLRYLRGELASGVLVAPHPYVLRRARGYYLVCPAAQAADGKVAALRDWLLAQARARAEYEPGDDCNAPSAAGTGFILHRSRSV